MAVEKDCTKVQNENGEKCKVFDNDVGYESRLRAKKVSVFAEKQ